MSSLCPHLFEAYLSKATDIIEIYEPQIVSIVRYDSVSRKLLKRRVLNRREHKDIISTSSEDDKMRKLLTIIKLRMWGLESLITIFIEDKIDNWLAEELFQAYVRHLVTSMKKIQTGKLCDCIQTGNLSLLQCSWFVLLEKLDTWLLDMGTCLGCLAVPLHPVQKLLSFIRVRLNLQSRTKTLKSLGNLQICSDSEESENEYGQLPQLNKLTDAGGRTNALLERSVSTPVLCRKSVKTGNLANEDGFSRKGLAESLEAADPVLKHGGSCPDIIQELEWDEEADPDFCSTFNLDTDYILQLLEKGGHTSCSSLSSSYSGSSSAYRRTGEMASQTFDIPFPKVSISTQTTPPMSPVMTPRVNSESKPPKVKEQQKSLGKQTALGKVAAVQPSPRRRVLDEFKAKKASSHSSAIQQPVIKDRLKPEDYGKWSSSHLNRSWRNEIQKSGHGTNVA